ncbi:MAG: hypothetical protein QOJ58_5462 [Alphaproteobacteria bacterium]|nr:hypothetical protein [Alphaproteobacteria bacterium]
MNNLVQLTSKRERFTMVRVLGWRRRWHRIFAGRVSGDVFLLLEPPGLSSLAAALGRRHGRAAFHVRNAALLNQEVVDAPGRDTSPSQRQQRTTIRRGKVCRNPSALDRAVRRTGSIYPVTTTGGGKTVHDDIVVFEVMTETLDVAWWRNYRRQLEREFRQDDIVVRASTVTLL